MSTSPRIQDTRSRVQALLLEQGLSADLDRLRIDPGPEATGASLPVASDAAAVVAAVAIVAEQIARYRGIAPQQIGVSTTHAGYCLNSFAHQTVNGAPACLTPADANPLVQGYRTRDNRWFFLHGAFEHLAAGTLAVLGLRHVAGESIAAAVASRDALELEEALAARGMCGAFARTPQEWLEHPQGRWLAARPCVELVRIGDAPPRSLLASDSPMGGLRVLDMTHVIAGPTVARTLAEHGAEVLHLASPSRPSIPTFVLDTGHGKRSAWLDFSVPAQRERVLGLVGEADLIVQGFRSGALERRGLGATQLAAQRPGLVYVSVNCYGRGGPWCGRPGWDQLAATATGLSTRHGTPQQPQLVPLAACDYLTGYLGAFGALVALLRQVREGGSWAVHISLARTAMWLQEQPSIPARPQAPADDALMQTVDSQFGQLRSLRPAAHMSVTPPAWRLPPSPLGAHPPEW